ncbi:MAG: aminotransferase class I/II-fold pyridoxal phosphate-dependent enzyme [Sulfuricaulis sp.]
MTDGLREIPPTAGLPLLWRDFIPSRLSLEKNLAGFLGQPDIQIECSGTAALVVALATLKRISSRRSVVIPAYTCPVVALAAAHCGLKPVLCDTRRNNFDISPESLAEICGEDTLAVIPTHLGGRVADLAATTAIAKRFGAYVVEDAAQSIGASWQGQPVGSVGDMGFYSLGVGKGLTIYGGGAVVARDENLRQQLRATSAEISSYRIIHEIWKLLELVGYFALYRPAGLGIAYGLPLRRKLKQGRLIEAVGDNYSTQIPLHRVGTWRKRIGAAALKRLPAFLDVTAVQAMHRKSLLKRISSISVIEDAAGNSGTWPFFQVLMPTQQMRDAVLAKLWYQGLGVGRLFIHALPDYPYLTPILGGGATPNARDFSARMLTISNSPWLKDDDFKKIYSVLEELSG